MTDTLENMRRDWQASFVRHVVLTLVAILLLGTNAQAQMGQGILKRKKGDGWQKLIALPEQPEAPDFTLPDTTGVPHTLSGYRGKMVMVNFWAVWCVPCRKEMPYMQRAWETLRDQGYIILAVNWGDSADDIGKFVESMPAMDFPLLVGGDKAMTNKWSVRGLPTTFIVDQEGRITHFVTGEFRWDEPDIQKRLLAFQTP